MTSSIESKYFTKSVHESTFDIRFQPQFKLIISGGSGSGKTRLLTSILQNASALMVDPPKKIFYFYQMDQVAFKTLHDSVSNLIPMEFIQGVPSDDLIQEIIETAPKPSMMIFDDFNHSLNKDISNLFQAGRYKYAQFLKVINNL
jgi:DNA replication protein DnaC